MQNDEAVVRAKILKALAHPLRLRLVDELSGGDRCGCELLAGAEVDQSVLSRHLAHLTHAGIVSERKNGRKVIYHLDCPCILQALNCTLGVVREVARKQSRLLAATRRK